MIRFLFYTILFATLALLGLIGISISWSVSIQREQLKFEIDNLSNDIGAIDKRLCNLESNVVDIDKRVLVLETNISDIKTKINYIFYVLTGLGSVGTAGTIYLKGRRNAKGSSN